MLLANFDPPANSTDFDAIPNQRRAWSDTLSFWFTRETKGVDQSVGAGHSQVYNPHTTDTTSPSSTKTISWIGFPQLITNRHPGNHQAALQEAETLSNDADGPFRRQDEDREWFVIRDTAGKIDRVDFSCEGPEFWFAWPTATRTAFPPASAANAQATRTAARARPQLVSRRPDGQSVHERHLKSPQQVEHDGWRRPPHAPANTLEAEINIVAQATILRARQGQALTDQDAFIRCAGYGSPGRATIRDRGNVNALARQGASITLTNPVGLYIDSLNTTGWVTPDGTSASTFWTIVRGAPGSGLRGVLQVPSLKGYTVSDIKIGGVPDPVRRSDRRTHPHEAHRRGVPDRRERQHPEELHPHASVGMCRDSPAWRSTLRTRRSMRRRRAWQDRR